MAAEGFLTDRTLTPTEQGNAPGFPSSRKGDGPEGFLTDRTLTPTEQGNAPGFPSSRKGDGPDPPKKQTRRVTAEVMQEYTPQTLKQQPCGKEHKIGAPCPN
jgi:hypothetical protein